VTGERTFVERVSGMPTPHRQLLRCRVIGSSPLLAATPLPSDDVLFDAVLRRRAQGAHVDPPLGTLLERWRRSAGLVVRRVQATYRRGSAADEAEIFQESARKLVERGLEQYRGVSEGVPGKNASPRTFFLRIVKHTAIDRYRRERDVLETTSADEALEVSPAEAATATKLARREAERTNANETYWAAFKRLLEEHPNEAAAWELYHHEDVEDHEQCARTLSISVVNSYKRVSRAQAYLRKYVLELGHER
jgi:RNA polymerase sigma-70 factor, ECF subfamily